MDHLCSDFPTQCFLDDIFIVGTRTEQHLENIDNVMAELAAQGLSLNQDKCLFFQMRVEYLGHVITLDGQSKALKKVDAIADIPSQRDKVQFRSFIWLTQYYQRYVNNLSTVLTPLTHMHVGGEV